MSDNNWTVCPRCADDAIEVVQAEIVKLQQKYGTISVEEFVAESSRLGAELAAAMRNKGQRLATLAENYEIGIEDGVFHVSYRGACTVCQFSHDFDHEQTLVQKKEPT